MDNVGSMNYDELLVLQSDVEVRLKQFRPVRIKKKWKRCGKLTCFCADGPPDGSWGNLHGPYVFAQFVDHNTRKTRLVSLGKFYDQEDINEVRNEILGWSSYFPVPASEYEEMSQEQQDRHYWYINVTGLVFEQFYGVTEAQDTMGRHKKYYATDAQHDGFDHYKREFLRRKKAVGHMWAVRYGVGCPVGQRKLAEILAADYYLK